MTTNARLGIDITAANKTAAAFNSVQRSFDQLNRSMNQIKGVAAAIGLGNVFERFISGIVRVNAASGEGKIAADKLNAAFNTFALQVGEAGLTSGLVRFAEAINTSSRESNGLADVMGRVLGSALTGLASSIPTVTAEVNDLASAFGVAADKASGLAKFSAALDDFARKYGPFSENAQDGFFGMFGSSGKTSLPAGTLERELGKVRSSFSATKGDADLLVKSVETFKVSVAGVPPAVDRGVKAITTLPPALKETKTQFDQISMSIDTQISPAMQALSETADIFGGNLQMAFADIISGTTSVQNAFSQMARGIGQEMANLAGKLASSAIMKLLQYLPVLLGGGGGAGFSLFGMMFGGVRAAGGPVSGGKSYLVGERGPEIFTPGTSGRILPNHEIMPAASGRSGANAPMKVTINNHSSAEISTRQGAGGELEIDVVERRLANRLARGGNQLTDALERGYGLRRAGR